MKPEEKILVQEMIDKAVSKYGHFSNRKLGDTPTDDHQLTPKGYVDSVVQASIATVNSTLAASIVGLSKTKYVLYRSLDPDTSHAVDTIVGGYFVSPINGSITGVGATVDTAGTTSIAVINIKNGGDSILGTRITIDSTETTSRTAATAPSVAVDGIAVGHRIQFDVDAIQSVAAKGLTVFMDIDEL